MINHLEKSKTLAHTVFFIITVSLLFCFFFYLQPLVILDSDDWHSISILRLPVPLPSYWNPSRIFPEMLMPLCGYSGALIHRFFTFGYVESISFMFAVVSAFLITLYVYNFFRYMEDKFRLSILPSVLLSALFLSFHFITFFRGKSGCQYMFWSYDVTCFFYYTLSAVLNCTLVLFLARGVKIKSAILKLCLYLGIYLAIFSNLFNSIILSSYAACMALKALICKDKKRFSRFSGIVLLWIFAAFMETRGGRAAGSSFPAINSVTLSFALMLENFSNCSPIFTLEILVLLIPSLCVSLTSKKRVLLSGSFFLFPLLISSLFLILLCSVISPDYILRPQVFFGPFFFLTLWFFSIMAETTAEKMRCSHALPILLVINVVLSVLAFPYAESNTLGISSHVCNDINNDLISQIEHAILENQSELSLEVMDTGFDDNWPHSAALVQGLNQSLVRHGVINHALDMKEVWSTDFNNKYHLEFTKTSEYRYYE